MTITRFDPTVLTMYADAPPLLHLHFGCVGDKEGKLYRYVRAEEFELSELDPDRRMTKAEMEAGLDHNNIRESLVK